MSVTFSEEQEALRQTVARFLEEKSPSTEVRRLMSANEGYDPDVWRQMADQMALQGLHIPSEYGGQGFTFVELGIVLEELGRRLLCAPYFATVCLAANAILNVASDSQKRELLKGIASGETIGTLAFTEPSGNWEPEGITMTYESLEGNFTLSGEKMFVVDGQHADLIVVVARRLGTSGTEGLSFFAVSGDAEGLTRTPLETMDETRRQARLEFSGVSGELLGDEGTGWGALSRTLQQAAVCLSSEMVGGAQQVLDMSVEYAKERVQFGRPIGSFQAIKHKCADMLLEVESAKSAAYYSAWAAAEDDDDLPMAASIAKAYCSDVYSHCAAENIQVHGGIGFSWEHDAHLYFRRAKSSEMYLGDSSYHRKLLVRSLSL